MKRDEYNTRSVRNVLLNKETRYWLFTVLTILALILVPYVGWNPILIMWAINAVCSYRETKESKFRFVHIGVAATFVILICVNLFIWAAGR